MKKKNIQSMPLRDSRDSEDERMLKTAVVHWDFILAVSEQEKVVDLRKTSSLFRCSFSDFYPLTLKPFFILLWNYIRSWEFFLLSKAVRAVWECRRFVHFIASSILERIPQCISVSILSDEMCEHCSLSKSLVILKSVHYWATRVI